MLLNIEDWRSFFHSIRYGVLSPISIFEKKQRLSFLWACIQDLIFYGGLTCNRHSKHLCKACYSKAFIKQHKEFMKEIEDYPMTSTGGI